jgi:hypothetical protein
MKQTAAAPGAATHAAFGLRFRSAIALPEMWRIEDVGAEADVTIARGPLEARLEGAIDVDPGMQVSAEAFQLETSAGRYRALGGRTIIIDPSPGASPRAIRLYLLGTVMAAVCHQRELLPLHAAAIGVGGGAIAIAGPSGAGKSTLAAQFQRRGQLVLADDLCAVDFDGEGAPWARPGLARIRLWDDSLALTGVSSASAADRVAEGIDKFTLPLTQAPAPGPRRLERVYILRPGASPDLIITPLTGAEAVGAVVGQIHRWPLAAAMRRAASGFAQGLALARRGLVFEVAFTHVAGSPSRLIDAIERHAAA